VNGNKRAAVGSALEFLARNGYRLDATSIEVYELTVRVIAEDAEGEREQILAEVSRWIEERLIPME
jgi:prophage maintenance system killer protein